LEDVEHTSRSKTVRTELKMQEVATLLLGNRSQMVDVIAATAGLAMIFPTKFRLMT
jgi:hypothetical protein